MKLLLGCFSTVLLCVFMSAASAVTPDEYEADIAFVLVGYGGETLFPTTESFEENASQVVEVLSGLSFGNISSYKIFDGGIDPRTVGPILAAAQITVIDEALSGWQSADFNHYLDSHDGQILLDPTSEQIEVLLQARAWLVDNQISLRNNFDGWFDNTDVGRENYSWIESGVLRFASACDVAYLDGLRLPASLDVSKFRTVTFIFSSQNQASVTKLAGAMTSCSAFNILNSEGEPITGDHTCSYSDYHRVGNEGAYFSPNYVTVHELIHGLGTGGHDESDDPSIGIRFNYSVMANGFIDQFPIFNRIYQGLNWLSPDTITENPAELQDHKGATDPNGKYLLKLSAENDFDCIDKWGNPTKCSRYQENYGGTLIQYKTTYLKDDTLYFYSGVRFEPLSDVTDTNPPSILSAVSEAIMTLEGLEEDIITITFDEPVTYGLGEIWLREESISETPRYQTYDTEPPTVIDNWASTPMAATSPFRTEYAPQRNCLENWLGLYCNKGITISGNTVTLRSPIDKTISPGRLKYSVELSPGAILDRGGNSVTGKYCAFAAGEDTSADIDSDGLVDCADAFPEDSSELFDTDIDGIGNNADADDDGDTVLDVNDAFPLDATETIDTDGDGLGDNSDIDDDGDLVLDGDDAFPLDTAESLDTDGDGIGNNADADDDGDTVLDVNDAFPLDATESVDGDGDGVGDNSDPFPDNALYSIDSDYDGMPDEWETRYGLDPNDYLDSMSDQDNDGVTALDEFLAGTIPSGSLDINGNGQYDALTDGLLLLRRMFGLDGSALITGTIASDAVYTESVDVEARIASLGDLADIDGNGTIDALTDGLLTLRYLFGLEGDTLIAGVVASDATRTSAADIEAHLKTLMPAL